MHVQLIHNLLSLCWLYCRSYLQNTKYSLYKTRPKQSRG